MKQENIDMLLRRFSEKLREMGYAEDSIQSRIQRFRKGLREFMRSKDSMVFDAEIGKAYLLSIEDKEMTPNYYSVHYRDIKSLTDFLERKEFKNRYPLNDRTFEADELGCLMLQFIKEQENLNKAKCTVDGFKRILRYFVDYLDSVGVSTIEDVTLDHVVTFIDSSQLGRPAHINTMRVFFRFLNENGIFPNSFCDFIRSFRIDHGSSRLPSAYTEEEVRTIENSVERLSNIGIRNYAMLLLATRLGLRISDIARIKFADIDWDKNMIYVVQYKTKRSVELPLLKDVGEAIIAYAKVRPISDSPFVFLSERPPYPAIKSQTVGVVIADILKASTVDIKSKRHGAHSMRHSLASNLLKQGVTLPVISEVLGHATTQSTSNYLRIDHTSLLTCALPVPSVSEDFYNQGGGVFYD